MELRLHTHIGPKTTASVYASAWTAKECDRVIEFLEMYRRWLIQDLYLERAAVWRQIEWRGMTAG